ncbi:alpha/beta hydrolase family protein [Kosmotoga pacifica]|uniref:Lysophospholipase n=1 Tax=Kosmotoga pacifica TaxID=1330330 RepID=A0A0G2ZD20_9BACT|nr:alpha/beta hydrolase family protein [Kosmotoga pacifica]AKI97439.1 lysophospholipase [Kosmotoga pacifica]
MESEHKDIFALRFTRSPLVLGERRIDGGTELILKSNFPSKYPENNNIFMEFYSASQAKGTVLFIHGTGQKNLKYLRWFAKHFPDFSLNGALMVLPYHFSRTPTGYRSGELFMETESDKLRDRFENAVVDALTCIEYLKDIKTPVFLMGYSFGGFIATITAALSKEVKKLSLVVTGGNFYHITWKSFATKVLRIKYEEDGSCDVEKCWKYHYEDYPKFMKTLDSPRVKLSSAPISCFEYDPLTFAPFVKQSVLMFGALFDIFIPRKSTLELYKAFPNGELHWLPTGHLTSIIYKYSILKKTARFFEI